ncbi:TonB-dependent receptor [Thalassotalea sp. PP2-459]|uniref:TonB-dependent receptor n=1 Tax=Thalassotalea sp. PP2-459 TaxID=1742724 RepID=UPI0009429615|nr:TonB-dependent receptor [Thalassotalea sp. PP2-459]OKY27806.1 TonB-dependent receptor [Thalassotalea sp. PP2-459]
MNPTLLNGGIKPLSVAILFALSGQQAFAEGNIDRNTDQKNKNDIESIVVVGQTTNTLVTTQDLEKYQANDLADVFRLVPSVSVGGSLGIAQKVYIRGMEDTLLNVTVDGAPQTSTLFHHIGRLSIDPELLKEVEVQAGAGEATAGSGAIGGAIRFKTKNINDVLEDSERFGGKVKANYFSNEGYKGSAALYGRFNDDWGVIASYVYTDRENMEDGDGNEVSGTDPEQSLGFIKLSGDIDENQSLSFSYESREEEGDFVQRPNWPESSWNPLYPITVERDTLVFNHAYTANNLVNLETSIYTTKASVEQDIYDKWGIYEGEVSSIGFDFRNSSQLGKHALTYGIEYRDDEVTAGAPSDAGAKETGTVTGIYIQDHWQLTRDLLFSMGLRYDEYELDQVTYDNKVDSDGVSPNLGIQYTLNDNWTLNLGYAQAMRGKEIGDSFTIEAGYVTVDPELEAEEVNNTELGLTYRDEHWNIVASVYQSEIDNVILDQLGQGTYYENVGTLETDGFELKVGYWIGDFQFVANYANSDAELNGNKVEGYEYIGLANVRGDTWGFNVNYALSNTIEMGWNLEYVEDLNDIEVFHRAVDIGWTPTTTAIDKKGYQVHDVYLQWEPNESFLVNLTVTNLLNEQYIDHSSVGDYNDVPGWEGVSGLYEAGRDIRVSLTYNF